jgi:hypothetical protein
MELNNHIGFFDCVEHYLEEPRMNSPYNNDPVPQPQPVVPAQQARQGAIGHNVRYVLGFGLAAIIVVLGIIWLAYFL